ncbi:hypothetical protein [Janthinobacterium sp. DSP2-3-3]|uniref:hypothetical protein n=1 Tax=Janthinobacterium sp. DSP2-3-3 TaxID=2804596 RepID=UPI003CEA2135
MRLDFNVLWVDDQPDRILAQSKSIGLKMGAEGFEFKPRFCRTIEEVESVISEDVFTDEVDLILVDWDLGNNTHGEDAIERIRQIVQYKDVVFYSGQATVIELREKAYERKLEGVYCAGRDGLIDEVIGVFESLIKKVLDLDHTRGIVMGATSDIDYMVQLCLTLAYGQLDDPGKSKFWGEAMKRVMAKVKDLTKRSEKLQAAPSMESLFKAHMLFTSDDRLRMLANILGMDSFAAHASSADTVKAYRDGVVDGRNTLGHQVLVPHGKPDSVVDNTGKSVDINEMRELRKLILTLRADFRSLVSAMQQ